MALFETIRAAIKTKADTDVAALRTASLGRRRPLGGLPQVFVHIPTFGMDSRPQGHLEMYTLTFPGFLEVAAPKGEQRADTEAADILHALIVSWRSGIQLGLGSSGVVGSWISNAAPVYDENDQLLGYDLTWTVPMHETLATGRTV